MLKLETKDDLQRLIIDGVEESLTLDYKASAALGKSDVHRNELCKDVTAFANSAGGQIVFGIEEDKQKPTKLDDGVDPSITKEWIEQIVDSNIQPRIEGLSIQPIPLGNGQCAYVITIPQATTYAPHMARDRRYYQRQNFQCVPMEDYQIRDALRRETSPKPYVIFTFADEKPTGYFTEHGPNSQQRFRLHAWLGNRSRQPAYYTIATVFISTTVEIVSQSSFTEHFYVGDQFGNNYRAFRKQLGIPAHFPIFQETRIPLCAPPLTIGVDPQTVHEGTIPIGYEVLTPGSQTKEFGLIRIRQGRLSVECPADVA
jgi:Putative DNA-binding domain